MPSQVETNESLYKSLNELGLTDHEQRLYALSLQLGPVSIAVLAEHLQIPRSNVYKVIAGLAKHGLAQFSGRQRYSKTFMVESPTVVGEQLRKKREAVAAVDQAFASDLPNLLALYKQGELPTKIKIVQGHKQFVAAFRQVAEEAKGSMCFFGAFGEFIKFITPGVAVERIDRRVERGIPVRALMLPDDTAREVTLKNKEQLRETRYLKTKNPFITSFHLSANKVFLWQTKTPVALIIEDEYLVRMLQSMFDILWDVSA